MQRTAVNRISDLLAIVVYGVFLLYDLRYDIPYTYEVFGLHQFSHVLDMVLFWAVTLFIGYWWMVYVWRLFHYRTFPWFFHNLGIYVPLLFWRGLTNVLMWVVTQLTVMVSWVTERSYPGRGIVVSIDFEDERDFKQILRTAKEQGLPLTANVNGYPLHPEEYDAPLSQHDLLGGTHYTRPTYDEDILDTSLTFPSFAAIHVVDAGPTEL